MSNFINILKTLALPAFTAILTASGVMLTGAFGFWNTDRSQDIQIVNIALSILAGEHEVKTSEPGRKFALRLLEKYSDVPIPGPEFEIWAKSGTLPNDIYVPHGWSDRLEHLKLKNTSFPGIKNVFKSGGVHTHRGFVDLEDIDCNEQIKSANKLELSFSFVEQICDIKNQSAK